MQYIDYYKMLGLGRDATQEEISRAFKTLARKYHPDLNKSPDAEKRFKEINEAHEVLKDAETRQRYDTLGANWKHGVPFEPQPQWDNSVRWSQQGPGGARFEFSGPAGGADFSDFFSAFMGGALGGNGRGRPVRDNASHGFNIGDLFGGMEGFGSVRPQRGRDIRSELTVELEDLFSGRTRSIQLSGTEGDKRYDVKIPHGIRSGEQIRLAGQGASGSDGQRGDLYLTIKVAPHRFFKVEGDDIVVDVSVSPWDAALGAKTAVRTLDGRVTMTLPPGVSSGQRLRLRGKGLPRKGGGAGDLHAEVKIVVPKRLTKEQRRLFQRLKHVSLQPAA